MGKAQQPPPDVLVYSSGNPAATYLAVGLLRQQAAAFGAVFVQGLAGPVQDRDAILALAAVGGTAYRWPIPLVNTSPPAAPVAIGITICVPT